MFGIFQFATVIFAIMFPIILIVFITQYFKYKNKTNASIGDLKREMAQNSNSDLEKEVAELRERIVVLESIVTERSYNLDRKIGNL